MAEQNTTAHNQVAQLLSAYIDDQVNAHERALVEAHVATCARCSYDLATLRRTVALLGQLSAVPAPRPFTLREADVRPVPATSRAWWQLPWARGLAASAALLLCVVVVAGVWLVRGVSRLGSPAAPAPVALQAPRPAGTPAPEAASEKAVEVQVEQEVAAPLEVPAAAPEEAQATAELARPEAAPPEEASADKTAAGVGMARDAATEAAPSEEALADKSVVPTATAPPLAAAEAPPLPSAMPAPSAEMMAVAPSPTLTFTLLEVEELSIVIEPGVIRVAGRLPLPEGRRLVVEVWKEGQPIEWAAPLSQRGMVGADGRFFLELRARPDTPGFNLFALPPAEYELRVRPVDPPAAVEARIPFDTYGPPAAPPTSSP